MKKIFSPRFLNLKWITPLVAVALVFGLTRCGLNTSGPASGTFSNVYVNTLSTACIECHVPTGSATAAGVTLDFSTQAKAYTTLLSSAVSATDTKGICPGVQIVVAGNVANSYLAAVLFTQYNIPNFAGVSGCTPYNVHLSDQHLSTSEQTSIVAWIQAGALNN